jgi:hypothetical protein
VRDPELENLRRLAADRTAAQAGVGIVDGKIAAEIRRLRAEYGRRFPMEYAGEILGLSRRGVYDLLERHGRGEDVPE